MSTTPSPRAINRKIPGPAPMPIVGWRWQYWQYLKDPTGFVWSLYKRYGSVCAPTQFGENDQHGSVCVFGKNEIQQVLTDPEHFQNNSVLVKAPQDSALYWLARAGVFTLNGEAHTQERRLLMPAFHKKQVDSYYGDMTTLTSQHLAGWKVGQTYNLFEELFRLTQNILIKVLFGIDTPANVEELRDMFMKWLRLNLLATMIPVNHSVMPYGRLLKLSEQLRQKMIAIIEAKREASTELKDMLFLLIHSQREDGSRLTNNEIVSEVNVAWNNNETTAAAIEWTLFLLMQHPDVLTALMNEFDAVLRGNPPTVEQIYQLPLLDRVIKESLRLFPTATFLTTRLSTEPFEIGGYHFREGTKISISPYVTHRIPEYYEQPELFFPDRWLTINPSAYEYIVFGAATHYCIGAPLANFEMRIVIPMILQQFRFSLEPNLRVDRQERLVLRPKNGLPVTVHSQDRQFAKTPIRGNVHQMINI